MKVRCPFLLINTFRGGDLERWALAWTLLEPQNGKDNVAPFLSTASKINMFRLEKEVL